MKILIFLFLFFNSCEEKSVLPEKPINYIRASTEFVEALKNRQNVDNYLNVFAYANLDQLNNQLGTNEQKITFWVNIYNGYILHILQQNPGLYEDRSSFFKKKQINIGNRMWSFADIEHGILRGSQHEYFLGYMKTWFPPKIERKMRVTKRDYRIHFVLNCGAKSCPPVSVLDIDNLENQLQKATTNYLKKISSYDANTKTVVTTPLFSWFRGDFGGKKGIKKILQKEGIIPDTNVDLSYQNYDWTLLLFQFAE